MGKEVKIGLAIVGGLLVALGGVLGYRYWKNSREPEVAAADGADTEQDSERESSRWSGGSKRRLTDFDEPQGAREKDVKKDPFERDDRASSSGGRSSFVAEGDWRTRSEDQPDKFAASGSSRSKFQSDTAESPRSRDPFGDRAESDRTEEKTKSTATSDEDLSPVKRPLRLTTSGGDEEETKPNRLRKSSGFERNASADAADSSRDVDSRPIRAKADPFADRVDEAPREDSRSEDFSSRSKLSTAREPSASKWRSFADTEPAEDDSLSARRKTIESSRSKSRAFEAESAKLDSDKYTVERNDDFYTIAEKVYGDGGYEKALRELNLDRGLPVDDLRVGDVLETPSASVLKKEYPTLVPRARGVVDDRRLAPAAGSRRLSGGRTYVSQNGDTLFDIARLELGKATRWSEIYELNRDVLSDDLDYLKPGTELLLPGDNPDDRATLTRRRLDGSRR